MNDTFLVSIATFVSLAAFVFYMVWITTKKDIIGKTGLFLVIANGILLTISMILRTVESFKMGWPRAPFTNLYESMVFFSWSISWLYVLFEIRYKTRVLGPFVTPVNFLIIAYTALEGPGIVKEIQPLVPALKSNWLLAHVITCFLSYGAFAISFGASLAYILKGDKTDGIWKYFPDKNLLDEINYKAILIGFPLLTLGIITGAAWAHYAWGSYWSWDPKETWSLITWLIYAAYLHARFVSGWKGKKAAILSIVGFMAVLFTYLGVNLLISGLHSYATS
ncbi:MAG: c-type cytochrome biogenesis protein CcsB [Thermosulfidibacteraceae bacterium]|jgi:cytochrome c-type biogenesis protein CcsB